MRDPFKLIEEGGYYYGRGTVDDKAMAAIWADAMIRFKQAGYKPKRTIKLALTCGEETTYAFNGARMAGEEQARPDRRRIRAERRRRRAATTPRASASCWRSRSARRRRRTSRFTATNPGGHSSQPVPDNAIYELADAVEGGAGLRIPGQVHRHDARVLRHGGQGADARRRRWAMRSRRCSPIPTTRRRTRSSAATRRCIRRCARPASRRCSTPAMPRTRCRSARPPTSIAASSRARRVDGTLAKLKELAGPKVTVTANQPIRPIAHPADARSEDHRADDDAGGEVFPRRAAAAVDVDRRDRRHLPRGDRHPGLRRAGRLHRQRFQRRPRPQRADPGRSRSTTGATICSTW